MTRSDKEIKEKDYKDFYSDIQHRAIAKAICWILQGPPRYSVEELKKIQNGFNEEIKKIYLKNATYIPSPVFIEAERFIELIKQNPKKVEEILE